MRLHASIAFCLLFGATLSEIASASLPIPGLYNTGVDASGDVLPVGSVDPHFDLAGPVRPALVQVTHPNWQVAPSGSAWIGAGRGGFDSQPGGDYTYTITFDLTGLDPSTALLSGRWTMDDFGSMYLNGELMIDGVSGFDLVPFELSEGFVSGVNELVFVVENVSNTIGNPTGLLVADLSGSADPLEPLAVTFGTSWDGTSLQEILDAEYGAGAIDVETDFEGAQAGDALIPYWLDDSVDGWIIREVADFRGSNILGWYAEELAGPPSIDGIDDGVIFDGSGSEGETAFVALPGPIRFGLYLNPNGSGDGTNAPEPEIFFTNRAYNDEGPDGSGAIHAPTGGDPQALIFNITHLRNGVPTYVVAWEDIDAGSELRDAYAPGFTDNDYNDLVVEIQASSPVKSPATSFGELKNRFAQ